MVKGNYLFLNGYFPYLVNSKAFFFNRSIYFIQTDPILYDKVAQEKRLQDTQLKLKRMLNDAEEKQTRFNHLQTENNNLESLCEALKSHINDKEKLDNIMTEHAKKVENKDQKCSDRNTSSDDIEIIRKQEPKSQHTESKTCVIQ